MRGLSALQLEHYYKMAQEVVFANHEEDGGGGVQLTRGLTLGCELSCTTVQGDTFRGNLVAHDEEAMLIVISIPPLLTNVHEYSQGWVLIVLRCLVLLLWVAFLQPLSNYWLKSRILVVKIDKRGNFHLTIDFYGDI